VDYFDSPVVKYFYTGNQNLIFKQKLNLMKQKSSRILIPVMMLILLISFFFADAQTETAMQSINSSALESAVPPSVEFVISLPDEYSSRIVRENAENAVYFRFKKSDGNTVFLFQVNKISENQWISIKDQLVNPILLDHRNGFIYYAQPGEHSKVKGPDAALYDQLYDRLSQLIRTIQITEDDQRK
jgi:hypothetical protein